MFRRLVTEVIVGAALAVIAGAALALLASGCSDESAPPACPDAGGACDCRPFLLDRGPGPDTPGTDAVVPDAMADAAAPDSGAPPGFPLTFGDGLDDVGRHLGTDSKGNVYLAGTFRGKVSFGTSTLTSRGVSDVFVAKMDPTGKVLWVTPLATKNSDAVSDMVVDGAGNVHVTGWWSGALYYGTAGKFLYSIGTSTDDIYLARLEPTAGKVSWIQRLGGTKSDISTGMFLHPPAKPSAIYLTGRYAATMACASTSVTTTKPWEMFVAVLSLDGQSCKLFSNSSATASGLPRHVGVDASGNIYLTGTFSKTIQFGTLKKLESEKYFGSPSSSSQDIFWLKMTSGGAFLESFAINSKGHLSVGGMGTTSAGTTYVTGALRRKMIFNDEGTTTKLSLTPVSKWEDIYVAKIKSSGDVLWASRAGGSYAEAAADLYLDDKENSYVVGKFKDKATFGTLNLVASKVTGATVGSIDIFAAALDSKGVFTLVQAAGGPGSDYGMGITRDPAGNIFVTGMFEGQATFGKKQRKSSGDYDAPVWKIAKGP